MTKALYILVASLALVQAVPSQSYLSDQALTEILHRGAPILGFDTGCSRTDPKCDWMRKYPDSTKLVHMNLPGTHDSATWNYSAATQQALLRYTGPNIPDSKFFRCQEHSLFDMLNGGIRVFDLRYAWNPGNSTVGFYHSSALLSPTTTIEDVFFGLYSWLSKHPTEAVLISLNHEGGTGTPDNAELQEHIRDLFASDLAKKYWVQVNGTLGTLGAARGKLTLLQRFSYDQIPDQSTVHPIGIHLDSAHWTDNAPIIELVYNVAKNQIAYIEDYYEIGLPVGSGADLNIQWKLNATVAHLQNATLYNPDQLYISFASSEHNTDNPPEYPRIMALGTEDGTVTGVNQRLIPWLKQNKGKRFGIIMLDFFDTVPGLVEAILGF